jgi:hypothetical protein
MCDDEMEGGDKNTYKTTDDDDTAYNNEESKCSSEESKCSTCRFCPHVRANMPLGSTTRSNMEP